MEREAEWKEIKKAVQKKCAHARVFFSSDSVFVLQNFYQYDFFLFHIEFFLHSRLKWSAFSLKRKYIFRFLYYFEYAYFLYTGRYIRVIFHQLSVFYSKIRNLNACCTSRWRYFSFNIQICVFFTRTLLFYCLRFELVSLFLFNAYFIRPIFFQNRDFRPAILCRRHRLLLERGKASHLHKVLLVALPEKSDHFLRNSIVFYQNWSFFTSLYSKPNAAFP